MRKLKKIERGGGDSVETTERQICIELKEYIKWIGMMRDSAYFEYLKEWIDTLSKGEYGEIASLVSSLDLDYYKKCQLFCPELQCKYFQFCMKLEDVQGQLTYLD
jgi:hypothetical protein